MSLTDVDRPIFGGSPPRLAQKWQIKLMRITHNLFHCAPNHKCHSLDRRSITVPHRPQVARVGGADRGGGRAGDFGGSCGGGGGERGGRPFAGGRVGTAISIGIYLCRNRYLIYVLTIIVFKNYACPADCPLSAFLLPRDFFSAAYSLNYGSITQNSYIGR